MSLKYAPSIVTDGLVTYLDFSNKKSFLGADTINFAYAHNAKAESSYSPYVWTTAGTWTKRHPDSILAHNFQDQNLVGYTNEGVGDWTNACHGIWTLDKELNRPVTTLRNTDSIWSAKSYGLPITSFEYYGMTVGSQYTLSWLQWTDKLSRSAYGGIYTANGSSVYNFWDGLSSNTATSLNTKLRTWQRVYCTFTVQNTWNLASAGYGLYMYGHYNGNGVVKIADVQFELKPYPSAFSETLVRNTSATTMKDITGGVTATITNLGYDATGKVYFNGTDDYFTITQPPVQYTPNRWTIDLWIKPENQFSFFLVPYSNGIDNQLAYNNGTQSVYVGYCSAMDTDNRSLASSNNSVPLDTWTNVTVTMDGLTTKIYINGVQNNSVTDTISNSGWTGDWYIGQRGNSTYWYKGFMDAIKIYNKPLSANEVLVNFNSLRGRFGI